jgi:hypothetical protein
MLITTMKLTLIEKDTEPVAKLILCKRIEEGYPCEELDPAISGKLTNTIGSVKEVATVAAETQFILSTEAKPVSIQNAVTFLALIRS